MIAVVARQQMLAFHRLRIAWFVGGAMLALTALAGVLGWSSHNTIVKVYEQATVLLADQGRAAPPNPFERKPALSLLSNMVVYVPLMGALLAIVVGHVSLAEDRSAGLGRLLFSRPLAHSSYALGKLAANAALLGATAAICTIASALALWIANGSLTGSDLGRLVIFYALSWLYLMVFALVGMVSVAAVRQRSFGLLVALGIWLVITFAMPQVTSGLRPSAALNPINDPVSTSQRFFDVTATARPISWVEQYREASGRILGTAGAEASAHTLGRVAPIALLAAVLIVVLLSVVQRSDVAGSASGA